MNQKEIEWRATRMGFIWLRINHLWDGVNMVMKRRTEQTGRELPDKLSG
jgi:hypothetical protein